MQEGQGVIAQNKYQEYIFNMYKAYREFGILPSQFKQELAEDIKLLHLIDNTYKSRSHELEQLQSLRNSLKQQNRFR